MNKSKIFFSSLIITSSIFNLAHAQFNYHQGQLNMYGEILESACTIDINSLDQTIDMGSITLDSIKNINEESSKEFEIKLISCRWGNETESNLTSIDISFTGLYENDSFLIEGDAKGIRLGLESSSGKKIHPNQVIVFEHEFSKEVLSKYHFKLLPDGGPLIPGSFNSIVYFNISYK